MGLHVAEEGPANADPVVFLHSVATTGWMWRRQVRDLRGAMRCITIDLPGHGESAGMAWESLDETVKHVAELIENRAGGRAGVVGMSLGGCVAARLAAARPELVTAAIVSGVSVIPASMSKRMWRRSQLLMQYTTVGPAVRASAEAYGVPEEDIAGFRQSHRFASRQTLIRMGTEILNFTVPDGAADAECPVLVVAGERESELVMRSLPVLARAFGRGEARYAPNAGARWNGEAPELFSVMVQSWITEQRLPPRLRDPEGWVR
ncbi:alpha/beta fold hydrolase [Phytoactinopolyspora halotolerans]|uniref:Alpha/beta hydrolase n=1 Tax=Phytoactinopolyspora halotolerans TaxID=1981512 RepID=A0A6L9S515_9ACTN|nr:alpha/beta hydrolase [Phytoactinopolyspora halotolerans]NED99591.1 alpha/beta hydrolase [Phytoactinopolyspora halotolerans]